jgi:hypothetical protein
MTRFSMIAVAAACCAIALALVQPSTTSRAASPGPTPVVSVTTLPALPSPGVPTAHPVTPAPTTIATAAPTPVPPGHPTQPPALPPPGTFILINGAVANPMYVTLDQLQKLRSTSITLKMSGHGVITVTGAPLEAVIELSRPSLTSVPGDPSATPSAYALITGISGQSAVVAFPEFEKAFEGKIVLLGYLINGKPPKAGAATLVVQGDATAGRFIEGVSHIQIVQPTPAQ